MKRNNDNNHVLLKIPFMVSALYSLSYLYSLVSVASVYNKLISNIYDYSYIYMTFCLNGVSMGWAMGDSFRMQDPQRSWQVMH
jgi:hypothetical protein